MKKIFSSFRKVPRWLRRVFYFCVFIFIIILFKESIYRICFSYKLIGCRTSHIASQHEHPSKDEVTLSWVIDKSLQETADELSFTTEICNTDPKAFHSGSKTNCIGYANECARACNSEFWFNDLNKSYNAETYIAQIYFLGFNIHNLFSSPFWKDHDVVVISNIATGEKTILDPTLYDYAGIGIVRESK